MLDEYIDLSEQIKKASKVEQRRKLDFGFPLSDHFIKIGDINMNAEEKIK